MLAEVPRGHRYCNDRWQGHTVTLVAQPRVYSFNYTSQSLSVGAAVDAILQITVSWQLSMTHQWVSEQWLITSLCKITQKYDMKTNWTQFQKSQLQLNLFLLPNDAFVYLNFEKSSSSTDFQSSTPPKCWDLTGFVFKVSGTTYTSLMRRDWIPEYKGVDAGFIQYTRYPEVWHW